jgi:HSP20 family protein
MLLNNFSNQEQETERRCRWTPATNITETDQAYQLEMAVPGFSKEDFKIDLEKEILSISNVKEDKEKMSENTDQHFLMREFERRHFCRSFKLNEEIDKDSISAEYQNGILMITLPKKEVVRVKKEIQVI